MVDETRAFAIRPQLAKLTETYPGPQDVLAAAAVGEREKAILARLWISEGIPFAFRGCPGLYEEVRDWLAKGLELDAKQISVRGSGRLGYSLAPKKWGERYEAMSSDLDLSPCPQACSRDCGRILIAGATTTLVATPDLVRTRNDTIGT